jgi:multicomponent Na+:H+ antiporter subunit B
VTSELQFINIALFAILVATAVAITRLRGLYGAAMLAALFSLVMASLFVLLDAVDVAFTEAAVGAGVSTVLMLTVLALTRSREAVTPRRRLLPAGIGSLFTGGMLIYASQDLPAFGSATTPVQTHPLTQTYLQESQQDIGIPNIVTSVLASYRGYDTLGELAVIFTAGIAVLLILSHVPRHDPEFERTKLLLADYRVLRVVSKILFPFIFLFALYVQFHGDYGPGGGFQAGVIFASAFVLYGLVFGVDNARRVLPNWALQLLISAGLLLYAGVGVVTMLLGGAFLDYDRLNPAHPAEGQHLGILLVELGVGITVAGVMTAVFFSFADRRVAER